jgi:hypothetical protein
MKPVIFTSISVLTIQLLTADFSDTVASFDQKRNAHLQKTDSLTIMVAASNYIYYHVNELVIDEGTNNFMQTTNKGIKDVILRYAGEAKEKKHKFLLIIKIQDPGKLNERSHLAIKEAREKYTWKETSLSENEALLIKLTEEHMN